VLLKQFEPPATTDYTGEVLIDAEVSVYSLKTGQEQHFGRVTMRGYCDGSPGRYVCPTGEGFTLFRH
jgi:hypothetical protein